MVMRRKFSLKLISCFECLWKNFVVVRFLEVVLEMVFSSGRMSRVIVMVMMVLMKVLNCLVWKGCVCVLLVMVLG